MYYRERDTYTCLFIYVRIFQHLDFVNRAVGPDFSRESLGQQLGNVKSDQPLSDELLAKIICN